MLRGSESLTYVREKTRADSVLLQVSVAAGIALGRSIPISVRSSTRLGYDRDFELSGYVSSGINVRSVAVRLYAVKTDAHDGFELRLCDRQYPRLLRPKTGARSLRSAQVRFKVRNRRAPGPS